MPYINPILVRIVQILVVPDVFRRLAVSEPDLGNRTPFSMDQLCMMRTLTILSAVALGAVAMGQTKISTNGYPNKIGMPRKGETSQDMAFLKAAAASNIFETRSSQIALENGSSAYVKAFAKDMIADHSAAFEELKQLKMMKGMGTMKTLPTKLQATLNKLRGLRGAAFDSAYLKAQKDGHADTIMALKKEIKMGHDSATKNYAIKILPTVELHAKALATKTTLTGPMKMKHGY